MNKLLFVLAVAFSIFSTSFAQGSTGMENVWQLPRIYNTKPIMQSQPLTEAELYTAKENYFKEKKRLHENYKNKYSKECLLFIDNLKYGGVSLEELYHLDSIEGLDNNLKKCLTEYVKKTTIQINKVASGD